MDMDDAALARIYEQCEQMRETVQATDARHNIARAALRDVAEGFRGLIMYLQSDYDRKFAAKTVGEPLRRACSALDVV